MTGYTPGVFPRSEVFELPGVHAGSAKATNLAIQDNFSLIAEDFKDIKPLLVHVHAGNALHLVNGCVDGAGGLSGLKLRTPTRTGGWMIEAWGAEPVGMQVRINPQLAPETSSLTSEERRRALIRLIPVLVILGAIILGLGIGLFTPTPAAGIGATVILIYGLLLRLKNKDEGLSLIGIKNSMLETAVTSGMIYFILFGAEVLKGFFARAGLPAAIASWTVTSGIDPWLMLIIVLLILIVLGCFMNSLAMILVMVPFFWPALVEVNGGDYATAATAAFGLGGEDLKIWFGIIALVVVELGLITPPVGLNVFIISALSQNVRMGEVFIGVMPFFAVEILRIILLLALPALCLFLPHYLAG